MHVQRIVAGRSATLTHTFYVNGVPADPSPDSATVTITRENGTAIVTDSPTAEAGTGIVTYTLTPAQTALIDVLAVRWKATFSAQLQQFDDVLEVRGDSLFTVADARNIKPLDDTTTYPTSTIVAARVLAEMALEDECEIPFAPTYFNAILDGNGQTDLMLPLARPLTVTAATIGGTALTPSDLGLYPDGRVYYSARWLFGRRNVEITGTYGYATPPARVSRACLLLAKRFLVDSPISDRATSLITEDGATQFLVTAGVRQAVFDIPECNAVVARYGLRDAYAVG